MTMHERARYRVRMNTMTPAELAEKLADSSKWTTGEVAAIARLFGVELSSVLAVLP